MDITVVVPATLQTVAPDIVGVSVKTVESVFQASAWNIRLNHNLVIQRAPDGGVYDADFNIRMNLLELDLTPLTTLANSVAGTPRHRYVVILCNKIVNAQNARTGWADDAGTNGATPIGAAISFISIIDPKRTIGNSDGQTWAHEIGHGLGLDHINDETNLMYLSRRGSGDVLVGTQLTGTQIATMQAVEQQLSGAGL